MQSFVVTWLPLVPLAVSALWMGFSPTVIEGEHLLSVPIPLLARMKMNALPFVLGLVILALIAIIADARWLSLGLLLVAFLLMLCIPVSYTLTTLGIRTGHGRFRRWTEFAGVRRSPTGAMLVGGQRASSYLIYLSGNRDDDEFVRTLKKLVLESYKGKGTERERLRRTRTG